MFSSEKLHSVSSLPPTYVGWAGALAGFGWVNQGSGKGVTGGKVLYDGENRLGRHETGYWGTELNKLDHTVVTHSCAGE